MAYVKIIYQNSPSTATPINAQNLNHMDDGIAENDRRLNELETAGVVNKFNNRTGNVTPEKNDYDISLIGATAGEDGYVPVWRNSGTEQEPNWGFEMEQQGGSGHKILDADGSEMAQEDALQFADSFVSDDPTNGKTVVENVKEVTLAELSQATERGMYLATDEESVPIGEIDEDYVEVTADGNTTRRDLFNWLFNHCDTSKIRENAYIVYSGNGRIYHYEDINNGTYIFAWESIRATTIEKVCLQLNSSTSTEIDWTLATTGNTKEENYSYKPANGYKYTLYYGTSSGIVELNTDISYSTAERKIGKWIDGSDLYEKTVSCGALPNSTGKSVPHAIANLKNIVEIKGYAIRTVGSTLTYPLPFVNSNNTSRVELTVSSTNISITTNVDFSYLDDTYVTLRYTKV